MVHTLEDLVVALFECATSLPAVEGAREDAGASLIALGTSQPTVFLSAAHAFLLQHIKLSSSNRAFVLFSINRVLEDSRVLDTIDEQQTLLIINLATQEMTMAKENEDEWPQAACDLLVTIAKKSRFVGRVMDALLQKFPPGLTTPPHRYVVLTFASIAEHNACGFIPFLTDILSRAVPLLQHVKADMHRQAWAHAIRAFCESLCECASVSCDTTQAGDSGTDGEAVEDAASSEELNGDRTDSLENGLTNDLPHTLDVTHLQSDSYSDQMESVYDVIFSWLASKDHKVRAEAANCVGELCLIISPKRINDELRRLIPLMLTLYRKSVSDQHLITQGICRFLEATCSNESCPLDSYLEEILNALFPHVCLTNESSVVSNVVMRNQSEAFRCFHVAAARFADKIVYYLLHKMQNVQDSAKLGAINVLRHLLNSSGAYMEDKRSLVNLGLKPMLQAGSDGAVSVRVKKGMCQLCVALADHGYVDVEGGEHVITFLVKNLIYSEDLAVKKSPLDVDGSASAQLRTQCGLALQTIANTCELAHKLLWPYLFEFVCVEAYTPALADIMKCIRILAERRERENEPLDFETGFDSPLVAGSHQVFSRLLTCMSGACVSAALTQRAREAVRLLRCLAAWFHKSFETIVPGHCAQLDSLLDELCPAGSSSSGVGSRSERVVEVRSSRISRWHSCILELLNTWVNTVSDGEWRCSLAAAMGKQLSLYGNWPHEKAFLMRCLGGVLARVANVSFVADHLILMFRGAQHTQHAERVGCAKAVGYCASSHADLVLTELENVAKWENLKKNAGLLAFIKDAMPYKHYTDVEMVSLRATVMLSYGYVLFFCPIDVVTQRLEQTVIVFLRRYMENARQETVVREALLETIYLVAITVHPSHLNVDYRLDIRTELIGYIKDYIQSETPEMLSSWIRLLGAKAIAALAKLDPPLSDAVVLEVGHVLTNFSFPLCRERSGLKTIDDDESATMMDATVHQFHNALEQIVKKKATVATATQLLKLFQPFYSSAADHERSRAVDATVLVLTVYFENATDLALGRACDFGPMSSLLARLVPRLADSLSSIRHAALRAVHWTFRLAFVHKGLTKDNADVNLFDPNTFVRIHLSEEGKLDSQSCRRAIKTMSEVIDARLPQSQMQTYVSGLFEMVLDRQSLVSSAAAYLLTCSLVNRGNTLCSEAETLVNMILTRLTEVQSCVQTYSELLDSLSAFAAHQLYSCVDVLLAQPLPYSRSVADSWVALAGKEALFPVMLDYLLELMVAGCCGIGENEAPFEVLDTGGGSSVKIVKPEVCSLAAAITELIKSGEPESELLTRVPHILSALLQFLAAVVDCQYPVLHRDSKDGAKGQQIVTAELRRISATPAALGSVALHALLERAEQHEIMEEMNAERAWTDLVDAVHFTTAMTVFSRAVSEHCPQWIHPLVGLLITRMDSPNDASRIAAVAVLSSLVRRCCCSADSDSSLLDVLVGALAKGLDDKNLRIRKLSVRGFGDLAGSHEAALKTYSTQAIQAAMTGLDDIGDRRDEVAMEAINALNKLSTRVSSEQLSAILSNVLLKLRPCFEKESGALRAVSFSLFGELGVRVGNCDTFREQLLLNIVSVLLHLNDEEEQVKQMCARCLTHVGSLLNSDTAACLIERELNPDEKCSNYLQFLKDFSIILAFSFPDRINYYALNCNNYFKSTSSRIRANAAHMTGFLLGELTPELRSTLSKELIFAGLMLLLKDHDVDVRLATARAISYLHNFA